MDPPPPILGHPQAREDLCLHVVRPSVHKAENIEVLCYEEFLSSYFSVSYEEEEELINVLKHTQNTGDIIALMGRTAKNRHAWIRTSKSNVVEILARYPHLLQPEIVSFNPILCSKQ